LYKRLVKRPGDSGDGRLYLVDPGADRVLLGIVASIPASIKLGELGPLAWDSTLLENRAHRALRLASATVDALVRVNIEFAVEVIRLYVDAGDWTHINA
jgi:hypothetical protein